ncbi:hypothetical protein [Streptomyces sp. NPDC017529]|uniref:hypothetical protein n=1 Tax=Streptomyces sp. NPDC017529 TaxID=3365000 RepID=UPI00379040D2
MTDASLLPHHAYAEAIAHCDGGPGGPYEPDEWYAYRSDTGVLCAMFYYRRTEPMTVPGTCGHDRTAAPMVNGEAWPHGLALSWDEVDGWTYAPLWDEFSSVGETWDRLPVPRLAAPSALRALLPRLLDGRADDGLPHSDEEWQEHQPETLASRLAASDARRGIDSRPAGDDHAH